MQDRKKERNMKVPRKANDHGTQCSEDTGSGFSCCTAFSLQIAVEPLAYFDAL